MKGNAYRLAQGGLIDRDRGLSFTFDGRSFEGHPGDTLASALLANGVRLVGRSFKYHRPRGILAAGAEEPNALVELRTGARREPNTRATQIELYDGLDAASQNRWPSLAFDVMAINGLAAPLLKAGFYYKTFMWPSAFWEKVYEPLIRRAAGLGRAAGMPDPDRYERATIHCDVLVVGAGPAGLMAALAIARSGARVVLAEQDFRLGGRLLAEQREIDGGAASALAAQVEAELRAFPDVTILNRTTVFGTFDQSAYGALERVSDHLVVPPAHLPRQRLWRIITKRTLLCAGALERPLVFGNNDLPGVMLAGAARTYVNRFAVAPGRRAVVFSTHDGAAGAIADLASADVGVVAVIDPRRDSSQAMMAAARKAGAELLSGAVVRDAHGGAGGVTAVTVDVGGATRRIDCDLLAISGGWDPALHLASHLGHKPRWDTQLGAFVADGLPPGMSVIGAAAGRFALAQCIADGANAGTAAARDLGFAASVDRLPVTDEEAVSGAPLWRVRGHTKKAFIDFQNDVTDDDIAIAEREGFRAGELMKRYTTLGMATDQGKTANIAGLGVMAEMTGRDVPQVGVTTFRPPYTPVAIGAYAGHGRGKHFRPTRLTPAHDWATARGAAFVEAGVWLRASHFPRHPDESWLTAALREARAVRERVGLCDVSSLGKIDVQGPDAGRFLDFVYANTISTLPVGKVRYGLMLREDGFVLDDGTVSRLAENHWLVTTTTANAGKVMQHLDHAAQVLKPELDVHLVSVTDQWFQAAVAGPRSRDLLRRVIDPAFDLSNEAFPFMAAAEMRVRGTPVRLFRISFSGELAYEIAAPAGYGEALMEALFEAGRDLGVEAYGLEALSMLRVEKGHPAGGELNGQTTARDLGLDRMVSRKKDCIGRFLIDRPALTDPARPILVGLKPVDGTARLTAGAHVLPLGAKRSIESDQGYVTSTAHSPVLGSMIGLGLVARGRERLGERVLAYDPVRGLEAVVEIVGPVFVDPEGSRLRG